jgi:hypothetical protein
MNTVLGYALSPAEFQKVRTSHLVVDRILYARSPARALRRLKRGFAQNFVTRPSQRAFMIEGVLWMHPLRYEEMKARLALEQQELIDAAARRVLIKGST